MDADRVFLFVPSCQGLGIDAWWTSKQKKNFARSLVLKLALCETEPQGTKFIIRLRDPSKKDLTEQRLSSQKPCETNTIPFASGWLW